MRRNNDWVDHESNGSFHHEQQPQSQQGVLGGHSIALKQYSVFCYTCRSSTTVVSLPQHALLTLFARSERQRSRLLENKTVTVFRSRTASSVLLDTTKVHIFECSYRKKSSNVSIEASQTEVVSSIRICLRYSADLLRRISYMGLGSCLILGRS